ncbi:MAG TPA: response regulator [Gemmatimonadales bacterium]|nr:response regulator [Gemmatimonadales bacterium]
MAGAFRALVIDDDRDLLNLIRLTLEFTAGWKVTTASSGAAGISLATAPSSRSPDGPALDLIVVDVMMPEMDGYEVCQRLKANPATAGIPIVLLTARKELDEARVTRVGAAGVVLKPFDPQELARQLSEHMP